MGPWEGRWRDAYEQLPFEHKLKMEARAVEAVARVCERIPVTMPLSNEVNLSLDPASQMLRGYEVYVRKARRYQMRQAQVRCWTMRDLSATLAWKAANEVLDDLRRIRRSLVSLRPVVAPTRFSDDLHQDWLAVVIAYLETLDSKSARDAVVLMRYVLENAGALTVTPKRGVSFKSKALAEGLTGATREPWDENRVQRARSFAVGAMSRFEGASVAEIMTRVRAEIA